MSGRGWCGRWGGGGGGLSFCGLSLVVHLQGVLQLAGDLLEEADLLAQVVLHLGLEVAHADVVEVLDLGHGGEGDDVAALPDAVRLRPLHLALFHVLLALLHFCQRT